MYLIVKRKIKSKQKSVYGLHYPFFLNLSVKQTNVTAAIVQRTLDPSEKILFFCFCDPSFEFQFLL